MSGGSSYAPGLARWSEAFTAGLAGADVVLLDGTFASPTELEGAGSMGHVSIEDSLVELTGTVGYYCLLAMVGTGHYPSVEAACHAAVRETSTVTPNAAAADTYARGYATYTQLYPALKHIYTQL